MSNLNTEDVTGALPNGGVLAYGTTVAVIGAVSNVIVAGSVSKG